MDKHIILTCPKCGSRHRLKGVERAKNFVCPDCRTPIKPGSDLMSDELTVESGALISGGSGRVGGKKKNPLEGQSIAGCRLLEKVGQGGMGVVYRAHHPRLDKVVALKVLSLKSDSGEYAKRFLEEARAAAKLEHENIVQVYDVGEDNGTYYIIMQFIDGESVEDVIWREGGIEPGRAAHILREACGALKVAHDKGLIHRDVKPENIFISRDGSVKLGDFGLVRDTSKDLHITATGIILGTPFYMAPEQFKGEAVDKRADVYALGISFFHMLAGMRPFDGDTPYAVMNKHLHETLPDIINKKYDVSAELADIAKKMCAKKVEDRYQSVDEVIEDIDAYLGVGRVVAKKSPILIVMVIVLVIVLGVVTYLLMRSRSEMEEIRALLARGGVDNVREAVERLSPSSNEELKTEVGRVALAEVDKVLQNPDAASSPEKVEATKKILKKLDAATPGSVLRKKEKVVAMGFREADRIDRTKHRFIKQAQEDRAGELLNAYRNLDSTLDVRVDKVRSGLKGVAKANTSEADEPVSDKEWNEFLGFIEAAEECVSLKDFQTARALVANFLKDSSRKVRERTREFLEELNRTEVEGNK